MLLMNGPIMIVSKLLWVAFEKLLKIEHLGCIMCSSRKAFFLSMEILMYMALFWQL